MTSFILLNMAVTGCVIAYGLAKACERGVSPIVPASMAVTATCWLFYLGQYLGGFA